MEGREEDEITAGEIGDERTDRTGDAQIEGELRGMEIGREERRNIQMRPGLRLISVCRHFWLMSAFN